MHCFRRVPSCFSQPCGISSTSLGQDASSSAVFALWPSFFCVLGFFSLLLIGSKLLSNTSTLCSVRGFASWMRITPYFSLPLVLSIASSDQLFSIPGCFGGFQTALLRPTGLSAQQPHFSRPSPFPSLLTWQGLRQGLFPSSGCGWQDVTRSQAGHRLQQDTTALSSPGLFHHPCTCT